MLALIIIKKFNKMFNNTGIFVNLTVSQVFFRAKFLVESNGDLTEYIKISP